MTRSRTPEILGLDPAARLGNRLGKGQDNLVHAFHLPPRAEKMVASGDWVAKVSHSSMAAEKKRDLTASKTDAAISGTTYKQNKYDILKHFLGDFIPDSMFFVSTIEESNGKQRPAEITIQKRVPQFQLNQLTPAQQEDPRLHQNLQRLMTKMQYMYSVLGEVNARTSGGVNLDAKMDLGGVSDFVQTQDMDHTFTASEAERTVHKISSPNLLIDPETMDVFCIDYDQGDWTEGMNEAKEFAFTIDERRQAIANDAASLAMVGTLQRRSTDLVQQ